MRVPPIIFLISLREFPRLFRFFSYSYILIFLYSNFRVALINLVSSFGVRYFIFYIYAGSIRLSRGISLRVPTVPASLRFWTLRVCPALSRGPNSPLPVLGSVLDTSNTCLYSFRHAYPANVRR